MTFQPEEIRAPPYTSRNTDGATHALLTRRSVWTVPFSLATTGGIEFSFFSSGYLDVSVLRVCFPKPMCSVKGYSGISLSGFPHSEISGSKVVCTSPKLIATYYVLHRLPVPRHPPYALSSFYTNTKITETDFDLVFPA